jgi:RNA polymerase sigma factor (sigma-70 family)
MDILFSMFARINHIVCGLMPFLNLPFNQTISNPSALNSLQIGALRLAIGQRTITSRRIYPFCGSVPMDEEQTTLAVQQYLDQLADVTGDTPAEPLIRALIERSLNRLHQLCTTLLQRSYSRLARPPLNLQPDEMLSSVVDRLLKALREIRPSTVRQFFALANKHMRWELNGLARRLDSQTPERGLPEAGIASPETSGSQLSPNTLRILGAIENLPEEDREVFDLVRIQGFSQVEAAEMVGVSAKTVLRRLNHGLLLLTNMLSDLEPLTQPDDS